MSFEFAADQDSALRDLEMVESPPEKYSAEDIIELSKKLDRGEAGAFEEMVFANIGLVKKIARQYSGLTGTGVELEDLYQEGCVGLIYAIDGFDWRLGNKFSTYAAPWIEQSVRQAVSGVHSIKLPQKLLDERSQLSRFEDLVLVSSGNPPSVDELSAMTGLSADRVEVVLNAPRVDMSLNQIIKSHNDTELWEIIPDESSKNPSEVLVTLDQTPIKNLFRVLNAQQQKIVALSAGLNGEPPMNHRQIAKQMGISHQRVAQIVSKSRLKLMHHLNNPEEVRELAEEKQPEPKLSTKELAANLSLHEIEILEMSLEGFSDVEIGRQLGIGFSSTVALRKGLAKKFGLTIDQLTAQAPKILQITLNRGVALSE